jgi:dimethylargininase
MLKKGSFPLTIKCSNFTSGNLILTIYLKGMEVKRIFKNAIVRKPCPEMIDGLTTAGLGKPDYSKALEQHARYVEVLKECGLTVKVLDADGRYPDSTFIEDVALCTPKCAVITNPGAETRKGEIAGMNEVLREFYGNIEQIKAPGTLEAGDIMMAGDHYYIGISARTNDEGAEQLINILNRYGLTGSKVSLFEMLHLKTGLSYIEENNLLIFGEYLKNPEFKKFNQIVISPEEAYSANSVWVNGNVLVPAGYPGTKKKIEQAGYKVIEVDVSEFRKLDGGLSCLSLRF